MLLPWVSYPYFFNFHLGVTVDLTPLVINPRIKFQYLEQEWSADERAAATKWVEEAVSVPTLSKHLIKH